MSDNSPIIEKLERIEQLIIEQNLLKKDVLKLFRGLPVPEP